MPLPSPAVETAGYPYQTPNGVSSRLGVDKSVMSYITLKPASEATSKPQNQTKLEFATVEYLSYNPFKQTR